MTATQCLPAHTGWAAFLRLQFRYRAGRTALTTLEHHGPLRVQRPFYPENEVCHVYMLHPPGGLVGGDQLRIEVHNESGSHSLLTTPGSAKFYRSAGQTADTSQVLRVDNNAILEWFPQENIFFPGAIARLKTRIELHGNARFIGWDINCLGRPANQEQFLHGNIDSCTTVFHNGRPLLLERLRVNEVRHLGAPAGLRHYPMQALFLANGCNEAMLDMARELLSEQEADFPWALTLLDDLLILRVLGFRTEKMQALMIPLWQLLRPLLLNREAIKPRIWAT